MSEAYSLRERLRAYATPIIFGLLAVALLLVLLEHSAAPNLDIRFGDTIIHLAVDRGWSLFPGDCVLFEWQLDGIDALYIDGEGKIGWDEQPFCPDINRASPLIEIWAADGIYRQLRLNVLFLPDLILYLGGFVGVVGTLLLAPYLLWRRRFDEPLPARRLLIFAMLLLVVGAYVRLNTTELPAIEANDRELRLHLWAEHGSLVFPRECMGIGWSVIGARSLTVNGAEVDPAENPGSAEHCTWHGPAATLEVTTESGTSKQYALPIPSIFGNVSHIPVFYYWCLFGLALAALVFVPLAVEKTRYQLRGTKTDLIVCGAFAVVVLMLYLPFGFDHIVQLESWYSYAYFAGNSISTHPESFSRFWLRMIYVLATVIDSESFVGFHLIHFALHIAKASLVYAVLRKLNMSALYAFLAAALYLVYPVNDGLLSSRSISVNVSVFWLLLAAYTTLDYLENPRLLTLAGTLLALTLNVAKYEIDLVLIVCLPLLYWLIDRRVSRRKVTLTACWFIPPVFKISYLVLLFMTGRPFYSRESLDLGASGGYLPSNVFELIPRVIAAVYRRTFIDGWSEALSTLGHNRWWLPTLLALAVVGAVAVYLARNNRANAQTLRKLKQFVLGGLLMMIPAIGVVMWFPLYHGNWRMYFTLPIGAAVALLSFMLLLLTKLSRPRLRDALLIALCLLLMTPGLARLYTQHNELARSADAKARILYQVLELLPRPRPGTDLVMMTTVPNQRLQAAGVFELVRGNVFDSAILTLYQENAPRAAYICVATNHCTQSNQDEMIFNTNNRERFLQSTLFLELRADLTVELIEDPATLLGLNINVPYDASLLYDADAPLPPRAETMLAPAFRRTNR